MPNWVYNNLTIKGNNESVNKLKEQLNKPFTDEIMAIGDLEYSTKTITYSRPVFAFRNIIAPTDLEAYKGQPFAGDMNNRTENPDSWYNWNNRNWGVKWDVAVSDENEYPTTKLYSDEVIDDSRIIQYYFETPWGIASQALITLSSQYPDLTFTLSYEEETGWGGQMEYKDGEEESLSEYNWKCPECDYEETDEPPYCETCDFDMCPECGWGEPMDEDRAQCQTHMVESVS